MDPQDKKIELYPSEFAQKILRFENQEFTLEGREFFRPFFDFEFPRFLAKCGRQVGKSVTLGAKYIVEATSKPFFKILHVTPTLNQVKVFSTQKLKQFIEFSPIVKKYYMQPRKSVDNVFQKDFSTGSQIILRSAYLTADHIRGISADLVGLDEIQDLITDHIPVILETLAGSKYKYQFFTGTPKKFQNPIEDTWNESTKTEYVIKCEHCGKWNIIDENNIGLKGLICNNTQCAKSLDVRNGEWANMVDDAYFVGIRVPQVLSPTSDWEDILHKQKSYSTSKFYNEVLALPYDDASSPFSEAMLRVASETRAMDTSYDNKTFVGKPMFMGVDWSTYSMQENGLESYTVVTIGGFDAKNIFKIVYWKKFKGKESEMTYILSYLLQLVKAFRVKFVGVDWGVGAGGINAQLRKNLLSTNSNFDPVLEFSLNGNLKTLIKWDGVGYKFIVNRTQSMTNIISRIREGRIKFPRFEDWKDEAQDFLNVYQDYNEKKREIYYSHEKNKPDDSFHALNFCYLAALIGTQQIDPYAARISQDPVADDQGF